MVENTVDKSANRNFKQGKHKQINSETLNSLYLLKTWKTALLIIKSDWNIFIHEQFDFDVLRPECTPNTESRKRTMFCLSLPLTQTLAHSRFANKPLLTAIHKPHSGASPPRPPNTLASTAFQGSQREGMWFVKFSSFKCDQWNVSVAVQGCGQKLQNVWTVRNRIFIVAGIWMSPRRHCGGVCATGNQQGWQGSSSHPDGWVGRSSRSKEEQNPYASLSQWSTCCTNTTRIASPREEGRELTRHYHDWLCALDEQLHPSVPQLPHLPVRVMML